MRQGIESNSTKCVRTILNLSLSLVFILDENISDELSEMENDELYEDYASNEDQDRSIQ